MVRNANNIFFMYLKRIQSEIAPKYLKAKKQVTLRVLSSFPVAVEKQYKMKSSATQYIHSPLGETMQATNSPPSRFPDANDLTI